MKPDGLPYFHSYVGLPEGNRSFIQLNWTSMEVSLNGGTPRSCIFIGFPIITIQLLGYPHDFRNHQMENWILISPKKNSIFYSDLIVPCFSMSICAAVQRFCASRSASADAKTCDATRQRCKIGATWRRGPPLTGPRRVRTEKIPVLSTGMKPRLMSGGLNFGISWDSTGDEWG